MRGVKGYPRVTKPKFVGPRILTIHGLFQKILSEVAAKHQMLVSEITGHGRHKYMLKARDEAIYRVRKELKLGYSQIGRLFNRDHSTIITSLERSGARERLREVQLGAPSKPAPEPYTMPIWLNY